MNLFFLFYILLLLNLSIPFPALPLKGEIVVLLPIYLILSFSWLHGNLSSIIRPRLPIAWYLLITLALLPVSLLLGDSQLSLYALVFLLSSSLLLVPSFHYLLQISTYKPFFFPLANLAISIYICYQSFNPVPVYEGWDSLATSSGEIIVRGAIGTFQSNALGISCLSFLSLNIFLSHALQKCRPIYLYLIKPSNLLYLTFLPILFAVFRTFSRVAILSLLLSVLIVLFLKSTNSLYSQYSLIALIFLASVSLYAISATLSDNFGFVELITNRFSFQALTSDQPRFTRWQSILAEYYSSYFSGTGFFVPADNFFISLTASYGALVSSPLYLLALLPFFYLLFMSVSSFKTLPVPLLWGAILTSISAILYSLTSDFVAQSKTLPILFFTTGFQTTYLHLHFRTVNEHSS